MRWSFSCPYPLIITQIPNPCQWMGCRAGDGNLWISHYLHSHWSFLDALGPQPNSIFPLVYFYYHFISSQFKLSLSLNPRLISFTFQCEILPFWLHFNIISISTFLGQFHFNLRSNLLFWFSKQFPHLLIFQSKALWYFSSNLRNLKSEVNVKSCEKSVLTVSQSQSICLPKHTNTLDSAVNKTEEEFID